MNDWYILKACVSVKLIQRAIILFQSIKSRKWLKTKTSSKVLCLIIDDRWAFVWNFDTQTKQFHWKRITVKLNQTKSIRKEKKIEIYLLDLLQLYSCMFIFRYIMMYQLYMLINCYFLVRCKERSTYCARAWSVKGFLSFLLSVLKRYSVAVLNWHLRIWTEAMKWFMKSFTSLCAHQMSTYSTEIKSARRLLKRPFDAERTSDCSFPRHCSIIESYLHNGSTKRIWNQKQEKSLVESLAHWWPFVITYF